jgi:hypothetical protein
MNRFRNRTWSLERYVAAVIRTALVAVCGLCAACAGGKGGPDITGKVDASAGSKGGAANGSSGGVAGTTEATGASGAGQNAGSGGAIGGATGAASVGDASPSGADGGIADGQLSSDVTGEADAASLTLPVMRGTLDVLEMGSLAFTVNPAIGARITSFKLDGDEMLTDATENPQFWGSTLWTSPASDWVVPGTFVPPAVVDSDPYATTVSPDGVITATSGPATANGKHFIVTKEFHADLRKNAIIIDYKITNTGTATFRLSHWEVTRVFPNGLMFFPSGTVTKLDFLSQTVQVKQAQGYTWYDNTTHMMGKGESKAGADSSGGFIAQVAPHPDGDLLFIKAFTGITIAEAPPGHFPIEFYCNDPHTYVEIEDHSSYDDVAPGATYTRTVTWYLRRLPIGTDRSVGSDALIAAALNTLGTN